MWYECGLYNMVLLLQHFFCQWMFCYILIGKKSIHSFHPFSYCIYYKTCINHFFNSLVFCYILMLFCTNIGSVQKEIVFHKNYFIIYKVFYLITYIDKYMCGREWLWAQQTHRCMYMFVCGQEKEREIFIYKNMNVYIYMYIYIYIYIYIIYIYILVLMCTQVCALIHIDELYTHREGHHWIQFVV